MVEDEKQATRRPLRLKRVRIRGFKALADVDLHLPKDILILIGGNGSGKSSVLQALAFVQYVAKGQPATFFSDRRWTPTDVRSRVKTALRSNIISYRILLTDDQLGEVYWHFWWHLIEERIGHEEVWVRPVGRPDPRRIFTTSARGRITVGDSTQITGIRPEGSAIGLLAPDVLDAESNQVLREITRWGSGIFSLELLSPPEMRRRGARGAPSDIGPRGERLTGFLASLSPQQKSRLVARLRAFYPLEDLITTKKRAGWVDLRIAETFKQIGRVGVDQMSDGFMRLLALASIPEFSRAASTVLLDEVEDGIEPHVLPKFVNMISRESHLQLVLTSHSPMLLNSFDPDQICFVARNEEGGAQIAQFDSLQQLREGMEYFGPGELWTMMEMPSVNRWVLASRGPGQDAEPPAGSGAPVSMRVKNFLDGQR